MGKTKREDSASALKTWLNNRVIEDFEPDFHAGSGFLRQVNGQEYRSVSDVKSEIKRRRTFAIISHPDAGKTTLTEKFLLYGGAINEAGSVKGKATAKHAVSD